MRYILLIFIALFIGCKGDKSYTINGSVPGSNFNGEYVYLIPMDNFSKGGVDSTLIVDSAFVFKGKTDSAEIYIIRAQKPLSRFELQDILVIKEPGKIQAKFKERSSVGGTSLNDSIQKWKEYKENSDDRFFKLSGEISKADSLKKTSLSVKLDSLRKANLDAHFRFVKNNRDNIVGKFVKRIMGPSFTQEQKKELGIE